VNLCVASCTVIGTVGPRQRAKGNLHAPNTGLCGLCSNGLCGRLLELDCGAALILFLEPPIADSGVA